MPPLMPRRGDGAKLTNTLHFEVLTRRNIVEVHTRHFNRTIFNNRYADIRVR